MINFIVSCLLWIFKPAHSLLTITWNNCFFYSSFCSSCGSCLKASFNTWCSHSKFHFVFPPILYVKSYLCLFRQLLWCNLCNKDFYIYQLYCLWLLNNSRSLPEVILFCIYKEYFFCCPKVCTQSNVLPTFYPKKLIFHTPFQLLLLQSFETYILTEFCILLQSSYQSS